MKRTGSVSVVLATLESTVKLVGILVIFIRYIDTKWLKPQTQVFYLI